MAGTTPQPSLFGQQTPKPPPTALFGNPATFTAAANKQGSDYDNIMAQYATLASSNPITATPVAPSPTNFSSISPTTAPYSQSQDVTGSLAGLSNLATTGGYSAGDIADIRARDISPIRSIYANAQQNVERQKALAGGYSPNYDAVQASMARDESNQIGDTVTAANAGIAQNVAANKLSAAPAYAGASSTANAAKTQADQANAAIVNQINEMNQQGQTQANEFNAQQQQNANTFNTQEQLAAANANKQVTAGAIGGQTSLYGTTPALTNTFGNQVTQGAQIGQNQQQLNNQRLNSVSNLSGGAMRFNG